MLLGTVMGTVVATRKDPGVEGTRLLLVRQMTTGGVLRDSYLVAIDTVDAGVGEVVMIAIGSAARNTNTTDKRPVDAVIMAVVDTWEIGGTVIYDKAQPEQ
jgi:microcompartment protein CcmK/EutM